jgi:hypothetical protein
MSWGIFRCQLDCRSYPNDCIDENLYVTTADALRAQGFADAGYSTVHMDDCWQNGKVGLPSSGRDPETKRLVANTSRFPNGIGAVAAKVHAKNVSFASYTAEGVRTCGQYAGSAGHEALDASTFADWGVDYLKVDGCGSPPYYSIGYPAMGAALVSTGRNIVYSCSWPVYIQGDIKPYQKVLDAGCNTWRVFSDVLCRWDGMSGGVRGIIDYWGDHGKSMQPFAGPGMCRLHSIQGRAFLPQSAH